MFVTTNRRRGKRQNASSVVPVSAAGSMHNVDIGIVTIRDDEFRAVLAAFPDKVGTRQGARRAYTLRRADAGGGQRYQLAMVRLIEQGQGEAQDAVRDMIDDLDPRLVLVVGIAGGRPCSDIKLGDVVVSTRIHDFTVAAHEAGLPPTFAATGGPIDMKLAALVANLAAREDELGDWTAGLPPPPPVSWTQDGQLYGPPDWQRKLRDTLDHHHGPRATPRAPVYAAGPIASSDRLVKDPELLIPWLRIARGLLAIEMESGGVYRAARERCPMLAIRGISDIVGLKRADEWTRYACASAAAFTRAFLRTRPVDLGSGAWWRTAAWLFATGLSATAVVAIAIAVARAPAPPIKPGVAAESPPSGTRTAAAPPRDGQSAPASPISTPPPTTTRPDVIRARPSGSSPATLCWFGPKGKHGNCPGAACPEGCAELDLDELASLQGPCKDRQEVCRCEGEPKCNGN